MKTGSRGEYLGPRGMRMESGEVFIGYSTNIVRVIKSRRLRWTGHVAKIEECRSTLTILTCKPAGKRPLGRPML